MNRCAEGKKTGTVLSAGEYTDLRNRWPLVVGQGGKRHNYTYYFGKVYMPLEGGADPGIAVCLLYNW